MPGILVLKYCSQQVSENEEEKHQYAHDEFVSVFFEELNKFIHKVINWSF